MKSYNQFVSEAYSAREDLNEILGLGRLVGKGVKALGSKGFKFGKYAGRRGLGAASAGYALAKGDLVGTGLGLASMLPGVVGPIAMGAQAIRSLRGDYRNNQPKEDEQTPTPPPTIEPPKDEKSLEDMRSEIDKVQKDVQAKIDSGDIKNPFIEVKPTEIRPNEEKPRHKVEKKKRTIKDIRDRDINARGSYDPRYDR
jgi:hypothetical protein